MKKKGYVVPDSNKEKEIVDKVNKYLGTHYSNFRSIDWFYISCSYSLSEDFINEFSNFLRWDFISSNQIFSPELMEKHKDKLDWGIISLKYPFIDDIIDKTLVKWDLVERNELYKLYQKTREEGYFIGYICSVSQAEGYRYSVQPIYCIKAEIYWKDLIMMNKVSRYKHIEYSYFYKEVNSDLGTEFENNEEINWLQISSEGLITDRDLLLKYKDFLNWGYIIEKVPLGEKFIEDNKDKISFDWECISMNQVLSEEFIEKYNKLLVPDIIHRFQPFSDNLINNDLGILYQQTKERGWFVGYIYYSDLLLDNLKFINFILESDIKDKLLFGNSILYKVRIWWKDLELISKVRREKFEIIRLIKNL